MTYVVAEDGHGEQCVWALEGGEYRCVLRRSRFEGEDADWSALLTLYRGRV
jgi:hypothetical protein